MEVEVLLGEKAAGIDTGPRGEQGPGCTSPPATRRRRGRGLRGRAPRASSTANNVCTYARSPPRRGSPALGKYGQMPRQRRLLGGDATNIDGRTRRSVQPADAATQRRAEPRGSQSLVEDWGQLCDCQDRQRTRGEGATHSSVVVEGSRGSMIYREALAERYRFHSSENAKQ